MLSSVRFKSRSVFRSQILNATDNFRVHFLLNIADKDSNDMEKIYKT